MRGAELDERSAGRVLEAHDAPTEARSPADENEPMIRRKGRSIGWLLGLAALIAALVFVYERPSGEKAAAPGQKQALAGAGDVAEVGVRDVPIYFEGLGTVQASNTVAIHSQVDGKLQSVNFTEGQRVKAGDVLAIVDPRPFQAALDQAKAKKAQDEAQLVSDAKDLARFQDLVKKGAGTQQAVDQQQAKVDALERDHRLRSGRHRERRDAAQLCDDHRADQTGASVSARSMPATSFTPATRRRSPC